MESMGSSTHFLDENKNTSKKGMNVSHGFDDMHEKIGQCTQARHVIITICIIGHRIKQISHRWHLSTQ